jgi:uncharacterized membrane protein YfcA
LMGTIPSISILFAVGLVAGTVNVLAGGGSLLTLPVMIFLGLPPTIANGTNRIAIMMQNIGAVWGFERHGKIPKAWLKWAIPPGILGAILGTWAAVRIGDVAFQRVLAGVMLAMVVVTLWSRPEGGDPSVEASPPHDTRGRAALMASFAVIGAYGGFIQAGAGFFTLAVLSAFGLDLVRGNALKVTVVLAWTGFSLAIFVSQGKVDWTMGLALAAGTFTGALLGVRLAVLKGQAWIKRVVTVMVVIFAVRLLWAS